MFLNSTVVVQKSFNFSVSHSFYLQNGNIAPRRNSTELVPLGKKEFPEQVFLPSETWEKNKKIKVWISCSFSYTVNV